MTELIWDGKYIDGKKQSPVRVALRPTRALMTARSRFTGVGMTS